nr:hypothetical protein [Shigella flexneri]
MKIEELREIFSENGLYAVRVENGAIVSHCRIRCLQSQQRGNDSNLLIVFYVQIMPDDLVMQLHRF